MKHRDISFTVALCASLMVHAAISMTVAESYVREFGRRITLPALGQRDVFEPQTPLMAMFRPEEDPFRRLGDSQGDGRSINSSPGDEPMQARQGMQEQAFLSRDPEGPGKVGDPPTESLVPPGDGEAAAVVSPPVSAFTAESPETSDRPMLGIRSSPEIPPIEKNEPKNEAFADNGVAAEPVVREDAPAPVPTASAQLDDTKGHTDDDASSPQPAAPVASARPGPPTAADPAPQADSESDPMTSIGSVDFRRGSMVPRLGRKHRLVRPRWTLDANVDLFTLGSTWLELKLRTDPTGNVISAEIHRSSGSRTIDQLCKVAAYEWWFEPPKSPSGQPRADQFLFTVVIN